MKILKSILFTVAVIVLIFSSYQLYSYNIDRIESEKLAERVLAESLLEQSAPVNVDFEKLWQENEDIIAWIYCEGTPINYPIVQSEDNSYYLRRKLDGKYSLSGTLFADYRCSSNFTDNSTIIYGHNMKNDTMFGILTEFRNQEFFDEHSKMYILTPDKEYKVELIAGVTVNSRSSIYQLPLLDEDKELFITDLLNESTFKSEYTFSTDDRFIILSTCSYVYNNARYVLVGLLEEI